MLIVIVKELTTLNTSTLYYVLYSGDMFRPNSGSTMALGSTKTPKEMSTRDRPWEVKAAGA